MVVIYCLTLARGSAGLGASSSQVLLQPHLRQTEILFHDTAVRLVHRRDMKNELSVVQS